MSEKSELDFTEKSAIKESFTSESIKEHKHSCFNPCRSIPKRYVLAVVAFFGFACAYSMRVNLSIGIVAMTENVTVVVNGTNTTYVKFDWSPRLQGVILSSFFWGYIFTHLPGGWLAAKYGGKMLLGISVFGSGILTIITPPLCHMSVYFIVVVRILEGLLQGFLYPSIHAMWASWAPPLEKTKLSTIAFSGSFFGTVVTLPLCGLIVESIGWEWVFYIFGIVSVIWFLFWLLLVADTPLEHPTISREELEYIQQTAGYINIDNSSVTDAVPWKSILTSVHVWAIAVAHFAENWGFYAMLTELPTYLHQVMGFNIHKAAFVSAIPYLVMCIMIQVGGQLADLMRSRQLLSTTNARKIFNCTGFVLQAILLIISAFITTPASSVACISFAVGFGGLAWSGFSVNPLDLAPQYASILFGLSNTIASLSGILSPGFVGLVTPNETAEEWQIVFFVAAAILSVGTVFFALFASGELQPWGQRSVMYNIHADDKEAENEH